MMRLVRYGTEALERYDAYVARHPRGTAYHFSAWMGAVERGYGHRCWYLLSEQDGELSGVLPFCRIQTPLGRSLVSLPFCDLGGPLADDAETEARLIDEACRRLAEFSTRKVQLRIPGDAVETEDSNDAAPVKVSMLAELPASEDDLFAGFKAKLRSQIRKASKNGLVFESGRDVSAVDAFYDVFSHNMKRLGSPVHSRRWFHGIYDHYADRADIGLVKYENRVVAAGIVLYHPLRASIPWASTLSDYNHLAPNMLLYWEMLRRGCQRGCQVFDFGRSTLDEGTYRFKKQWGAEPHGLNWDEFGRSGRLQPSVPGKPGLLGRLRPWVESGWQALPDPVANRLGPKIRRYISL